MATKRPQDRRCSYVVLVRDAAASTSGLRELASYLSGLGVADCDVVIVDPSPRLQFELNGRILRWVGRHVAGDDLVRGAMAHAACEKVIVAADDIRYTGEAISQMCELLDAHDVIRPQDYLDPMPWWGGIDAGRILLHRGIEPQPDHDATFGFRRKALCEPRPYAHPASEVFVRRQPAALGEWLSSRPRLAGADFKLPLQSAFFFTLVPVLVLLAVLGGLQLAGGYAGVIAVAAVGLAVRGRAGASSFFPLRACFFAPLWVLERSLSVYWALLRKLRGVDDDIDMREAHVIPSEAEGAKLSRVRPGNST